jgi:hypothetical protein
VGSKTFPDNHIDNRPYKTLIALGEWTCSIARFTGTMKGPLVMADGKTIPPTFARSHVGTTARSSKRTSVRERSGGDR